jgi:hypothetical protein
MKHILIFILISLVGCSSLDKPILSSQVIGCYASGDELRYNHAYLKIFDSGKYSIETVGDIGSWGTIDGNWVLKNSELYFVTDQTESNSFVVNPKRLYVTLNNKLLSTRNNKVNYLSFDTAQSKGMYSENLWGVFEFDACEL